MCRPDTRSCARILFLTFVLLALGGCTAVKVKLGRRVELQKLPLSSIAMSLPGGPSIAPGEASPLVVSLTQPDGTVLLTEGEGRGKVLWKDLDLTASVVTVDKKGTVSLPRDPRISQGKVAHVSATVPSHPDLHAELDIAVAYDHAFSAIFVGPSGGNGMDGTSGLDGMDGSVGSADPANPVAGGDGTDGSRGSDGSNGSDGDDGPPVEVRVALKPGSPLLLQVSTSAQGHEELFLVNPNGGSLTVRSDGGAGGSGGKGGRGGRGGRGGFGSPSGRNGSDGSDGQDGLHGSPGRSGAITLIYDPAAKPYLGAVRLPNKNPAPVFREAPVPSLW